MKKSIILADVEKEIIVLKATLELIDSMVNNEMLRLYHNDPNSEIRFESATHQNFFSIILVDFLSEPDADVFGIKEPYLSALKSICSDPHFNVSDSVNDLRIATTTFDSWLEHETFIENIWLPSIEKKVSLQIKRIEFLRICGNISKHNFTRLTRRGQEIQSIFNRNKEDLSLSESLLALDDFYQWFYTNVMSYHSSAIAEFLNGLRWGIYKYLEPEFHSSIVHDKKNPPMYHYTYSKNVTDLLAKNYYLDLMNDIRSKPYMPRFEVTKFLKMRY